MTLRHGYFSGSGYTYHAYPESSPDRLALLCLLRSHRPPDLAGEFRLLELGCGQGVQLCLQAANYPQARFLGIDFNPEHIAHARALAASAGLTNIAFREGDFLALEQEPEALGEAFDLVVAHGVLGWVAPSVGAALMRLSSAALRPGGVFYLSYNTLPGWVSAMPFQHLIRTLHGVHGDGLPALEEARKQFDALKRANAQIFNAQPGLAPRLETLAGQDPAYLLHEYNHSAWQPLYANQVIEAARDQNLSYLGTANLAENFDGLLPEAYRQLLRQPQDDALRELQRDLLTNQVFRRDVYVKGRDPLWPNEASAAIDRLLLQRLQDPQSMPPEQLFKFRLSFGEMQGNPEWFRALLESMGEQPVSIAALKALHAGTALPELLQNLTLLIASKAVVAVPAARDHGPAHRFNAHIVEQVAAGAPYRFLACPVSGNIHFGSDIELLAVHALQKGHPEADLAEAIGAALQALDRHPMADGRQLKGDERHRALQQIAETFLQTTLPQLRRLGALP
jgi:SAM-dependent methyltransferase